MNRSYKYRRGLKGGPNEINVQGSISVDGYKSGSKDVNNDFNIIKSNNITMKGVDFPVHGTDNLGYSQIMMPGLDYTFPGNEVFEVPLKEYGGPGGRTTALRNFMYDKKRNKDFAQNGIEVPKRKGVRLNYDEEGNVIGESTHLMRAEQLEDGTWVSFPSLFQNEDEEWIDMSEETNWMKIYEEAKRRGEVINFGDDKEAALAFGKGSWKPDLPQLVVDNSIERAYYDPHPLVNTIYMNQKELDAGNILPHEMYHWKQRNSGELFENPLLQSHPVGPVTAQSLLRDHYNRRAHDHMREAQMMANAFGPDSQFIPNFIFDHSEQFMYANPNTAEGEAVMFEDIHEGSDKYLKHEEEVLKNAIYKQKGGEHFYQFGGDILKSLKEKIRDEIAPVGYNNALNRIIDVLNPWNQDKETEYEEQKTRYDKYSPTHGDDNYDPGLFQGGVDVLNERQDLFSILLGLDQKHNTIPVSKYKPTKTKNNDDINYYSSPLTEKQITDHLAGTDIAKRFGNVDEFKKFLNNPTGYDKWKIGYGEVTGNFHIDHGEDERGPYISYYDIWDLDPFGVGDWTEQNKILKAITDFGQNKILGVQPAELYNRLYYTLDDEGKIRFDDYPDAMSAYDRQQLEKEKQKGGSIFKDIKNVHKQYKDIRDRYKDPNMVGEENVDTLSNWQKIKNVVNWRENLAENLNPFGYQNPVGRLYEAVVLDRAAPGSVKGGYSPYAGGADYWTDMERQDLLQIMLNKPQVHNSIEKQSKYWPTNAKENFFERKRPYYKSKRTEMQIRDWVKKNNIKDILNAAHLDEGFKSGNLHELISTVAKDYNISEEELAKRDAVKNRDQYNFNENYGYVLGNYTMDYGIDPNDGREYISYYDKWNINPTDNISDDLIDKTLNLQSPEIYGRVYLDEIDPDDPPFKTKEEDWDRFRKQSPKLYNIKSNKQKGGATVPTEQVAQDDPRYNRDMDDDGVPVGIDVDDSREVPNQLMLLQAMKESSLDPKKISKKGAKGLTQVMPATLQDYIKNTGDKDVNLYDWKDSMKVQKWYMNNLYNRPWINKQNQNQNVRLAKTLAAYNWGPTKFNTFLNKVKDGVDIYDHKMEWLDHPDLPIETRDYIKTVLLRENEEFEGWIQEHNKNESKQAYIEAYGGIYKKGGSLLFPEWKRIRKHWKNYLSGKSINRDMYNKMVAYGFIKKKKYKRPDKRNRSFKNISSKNILKALNLGKMKKGGSLPEQVKIYEDYVRGVFDGTDLEEKAKRTADKIDRFYYYDLKGKDTHTLDHIKKLQKGGGDILSDIQNTARLNEEGYDAKLSDLRQYQRPGDMTKEEKLDATETALSFFPFTGEAIDAKNTIKSAVEGRYGDAALNAAGLMIPFVPGKVLVKGKNAIKGLFKKGSKETAEKVVKEMPEWSKGKTSYNPENFLTDPKVREEYIKSGKWNEAIDNALKGMKNQGKHLDEIGFDAKTLRGENMVFHGVDDGRSVVEVALPDGRTQLFYKSTDMSKKGVGDMWQPYGGHSYHPSTTDDWFIKDAGYENFYDSKSYKDIATELDRHMIEQGWDMSDQIVMIDGKPTYPYRK